MQALGLIETRGLLAAIECADVMLKTAQVELMGRTLVGGGLVTVAVAGDVGAVKAAIEAGAEAVKRIGSLLLISQHVIPRPHDDIANIVMVKLPPYQLSREQQVENPERMAGANVAQDNAQLQDSPAPVTAKTQGTEKNEVSRLRHALQTDLCKANVDSAVQELGLMKTVELLAMLPVVKLRNLAREFKELEIAGRAISKANKELLLQQLVTHYERNKE